jgi:glycosyltransferase involved in cell wall biosynthesis
MLQILIPAYKAQHYLNDCLASLRDQTTTIDYEVLLGIDG